MKILMVNPNSNLNEMLGVGKVFVQKYEPLGILYIAANLIKNGYDVSVIDCFAENLSCNDLKTKICDIKPDVISFSVLTASGSFALEAGQWIKSNLPDIFVIMGNVHASVYSYAYLYNKSCDLVIHGEGEEIFLEILKRLEKSISFGGLDAVSFVENGRIYENKKFAFVKGLDSMPHPARHLLKKDLYKLLPISNQPYISRGDEVVRSMMTSRGCPNRCTFCVVHHGSNPRFRSPENVLEEMLEINDNDKASYVVIQDPLFMANKRRAIEICEKKINNNIGFLWEADAHVKYADDELLSVMEKAGCYALSFGIESGVQRLLDGVRKGTKLNDIISAVERVKKRTKIKACGLFILGLPGETYEDTVKTIEFAKSLPLDMAQFSICTPYPGSPLYEELVKNKMIDTGIREDGSIDVDVWNRYSAYISFTDNDPIWVTGNMTAGVLKKMQKRAQREFYLRPSQIVKQIKRINKDNFWQVVRIAIKGFF